jgi:NADH dehydrogenase
MGEHVARTIKDEVANRYRQTRKPFRYRDKGSMATIGRGKAIAWIGGKTLGGFLGWITWGLVHVMFLVGFQTKFMVMLDWVWNYLSFERGARIITGDPKLKIKEVRGIRSVDINE